MNSELNERTNPEMNSGAFMWQTSKLRRVGSNRFHSKLNLDFIDTLNYKITTLLILTFIGLLAIYQYTGKPIQCWIPQEFTRGWEEYAENYCWVSNTYFSPIQMKLSPIRLGGTLTAAKQQQDSQAANVNKATVGGSGATNQAKVIGYYQWAPIVLALQAMLFYMPCMVWRLLADYSHFNITRIIQSATDASLQISCQLQQRQIRFLSYCIAFCIDREHKKKPPPSCGRQDYLVVLYFVVKCLYLANACGQLYLMERFLGTSYTLYGIQVLNDLFRGLEWSHSGLFPRVTFCDFETRKLGKNHLFSLQCVLPINMFLEKIYIFLWFWNVLVALMTTYSLVYWLLDWHLHVPEFPL